MAVEVACKAKKKKKNLRMLNVLLPYITLRWAHFTIIWICIEIFQVELIFLVDFAVKEKKKEKEKKLCFVFIVVL